MYTYIYIHIIKGGRGRVLMITLTDGKRECVAVEYGAVQGLSLDTPPGTKLRISSANVCAGVVLLDSQCCVVLGGVVPAMKEEWETLRRYSNVTRRIMKRDHRTGGGNEEDDEPPPKFAAFNKGAAAAARQQQQHNQQQQQQQQQLNQPQLQQLQPQQQQEMQQQQSVQQTAPQKKNAAREKPQVCVYR